MKHLLLLLPLLPGCANTLVTHHGVVRGGSPSDRSLVALALEEADLTVRRALEVEHKAPSPVVRLRRSARVESGAYASCRTDAVHLGTDALAYPEAYLAHELVHWYFDFTPYRNAPHFINEGIAQWVAVQHFSVHEWAEVPVVPREWLDYSAEDHVKLSSAERVRFLQFGYQVVRSLGLPEVRRLADQLASPEEYLAALR